MLSERFRLTTLPRVAMGFCAALSLICLVSYIGTSWINGTESSGNWVIPFLCFLPMCFYFVGLSMMQMQREIGELRKQLTERRSNDPA